MRPTCGIKRFCGTHDVKTHRKLKTAEKKHDFRELQERIQRYCPPSGPFDYAERGAAVAETEAFRKAASVAWTSDEWSAELWALRSFSTALWKAAVNAAYPPGFAEDFARLKQGDKTGLETAIRFLEADPFFFGTGYVKKKLIRFIKPPMLSSADAARLRNVVISMVDKRHDREFRAFCRLARKVDAPELRTELTRRLESDERDVRRRARWVLEALEQK